MKKTIFLSLFLAATLLSNSANSEPASRQSIKQLMDLTGAGNTGVQMLGQLKKMMPGVSAAFWEKFLVDVNVDELTDLIAPIYRKHLTQEDVDAMVKFYATPTGKKLITKMPLIKRESVMVSQKWGQNVAYQLIQKKQKETADKKQQKSKQ